MGSNGSGPSFVHVLHWLTGAYPEGVPGRDRYALVSVLAPRIEPDRLFQVLSLLRPTELDPDLPLTRDELDVAISEVRLNPPPADDVRRVAGRLAKAGWPLLGTD